MANGRDGFNPIFGGKDPFEEINERAIFDRTRPGLPTDTDLETVTDQPTDRTHHNDGS